MDIANSQFDVLEIRVQSLVGVTSSDLAARYRAKHPRLLLIRYEIAPIVTIVLCSPIGVTWRKPPIGSRECGNAWESSFVTLLENDKLYTKEAAASGLKSRSITQPLFFAGLPRHEGNHPCEMPRDYLCSWFHTFSVSKPFADRMVEICNLWLQQLTQCCFIEAEDVATGSQEWQWISQDKLLQTSPDYWLFAGLWTDKNRDRWTGDQGIAETFQARTREIRQSGRSAMKLSPNGWAKLSLPAIRRQWLSKSAINASKRMTGGTSVQATDISDLDIVFSSLAQFVNALDDPALYAEASVMLYEEKLTLQKLPLTENVPADPFKEISEYLERQKSKYPVLSTAISSPAQWIVPSAADGGVLV
jgi:hypothetical protein